MRNNHEHYRGRVSDEISLQQLQTDKYWLPFEFRVKQESASKPGKTADDIEVYWARAQDINLSHEFFFNSLLELYRRSLSDSLVRCTPLQTFLEYAESVHSYAQPEVCFFHISRCGSTLACNLAKSVGYAALSEPQPIDFILRIRQQDNITLKVQGDLLLKLWVSVWGEYFQSQGQKYVIKPDCWLNPHIHNFLQAMPTTQPVLLWRDLTEVVASHTRQPGSSMIPDFVSPDWLGLKQPQNHMIPDGYLLDVIASLFRSGIKSLPTPEKNMIHYKELVPTLFKMYGHINPDAFEKVSRTNAKQRGVEYVDNTSEKLARLTLEQIKTIKNRQREILIEQGLDLD